MKCILCLPGPSLGGDHESMFQKLPSPNSPTLFMYPYVPLTIVGSSSIASLWLEISDFAKRVGP
jgi:hypothetical protein